MDIFLFIKDNHTWQEAILHFGLTGPQVVSNVILRTAMGYKWGLHQPGGRNSIISQVDEKELIRQLKERADQADCVSIYEALTIAVYSLRYFYFEISQRNSRIFLVFIMLLRLQDG